MKKVFKYFLFLFGALVFFVAGCNFWVVFCTKDKVYENLEEVPGRKVALVLGTSKYSKSGMPNKFFHTRISAAVKLYKSGKVKRILLSGDNSSSRYYNEPGDMRKALIRNGVPDSVIVQDKKGIRTFDSVVRSKNVFRQNSIIIITQRFHAYRALLISEHHDIEAVAFATESIPLEHSFRVQFRECFARCKAVIDLYLLRK